VVNLSRVEISEIQPDQFDALAALEARVLEADGVRLKLEWSAIRSGRNVASLVHLSDGEIIGFIGLSSWGGPPDVELVGMVDPAHRRTGVGTALLDRGLEICAAGGYSHRLAVVPRDSEPAGMLVRARGGQLQHSEYSLILTGEPARRPEDPLTTLAEATEADRADRLRILTAGFGPPPDAALDQLRGDNFENLMIEHAGRPVGQVRLSWNGRSGFIAGFAIDPEYRGRGIGRDALARFCARLRERGSQTVELQVEAQNDLALGLYTSTGFTVISTEDYYRLRPTA
jgi:ribosomal protein S18 acetylase RimI-like enzyme